MVHVGIGWGCGWEWGWGWEYLHVCCEMYIVFFQLYISIYNVRTYTIISDALPGCMSLERQGCWLVTTTWTCMEEKSIHRCFCNNEKGDKPILVLLCYDFMKYYLEMPKWKSPQIISFLQTIPSPFMPESIHHTIYFEWAIVL